MVGYHTSNNTVIYIYLNLYHQCFFYYNTDYTYVFKGATEVEPVTSRTAVECFATQLYPLMAIPPDGDTI